MEAKINFNCTRCGQCCKQMGFIMMAMYSDKKKHLPQYVQETFGEFPYRPLQDGTCIMLDQKTNLCKVYETRPDICNLPKLYERFPDMAESYEKYLEDSAEACNDLIVKSGLQEKFIIKQPFTIIQE